MSTCLTYRPQRVALYDNSRQTPAARFSGWSRMTGVSDESETVMSRMSDISEFFLLALSFPFPLELEFQIKASEWKQDTRFCSSPEISASHPAYKRIIGMGPAVVPFILEDLSKSPALWFDALTALTDEQPILPDHAGDMDAMAADWLEWGRKNGLV